MPMKKRGHSCPWLQVIALSTLWSCAAPKPPPQTPDKATEPSMAIPKPPPRRDVSEEGKAAFREAVQALEAARSNAGGLQGDGCSEVARKFRQVYDDFPKLIEAKFNEGVILHICGQTAKAEQVYQELLQKEPGYGPALNNLGQLARERGDEGQAQSYFERAAQLKDSHGYANIALLQRERALRGDTVALKEAINNLHRALAVDSFNVGAYEGKAVLVYDHAKDKSQLEIARLICIQAIDRFPNYAPVHNVLGLVLLRMSEVTRALKEFRQAVALDPNLIDAHMNIGAITLSFRDYKAAEDSFARVLSLSPAPRTRFEATVGLGVAYRGQGRFREAMEKYKQAKALDSSSPVLDYNMGILLQDYLFDAANASKAIETLQEARGLLQRYVSSGSSGKSRDAEQRIKNIDEMIPLLREQQKMVQKAGQG